MMFLMILLMSTGAYAKNCSTKLGAPVCVGETVYTCHGEKPCARPLVVTAIESQLTSWFSVIDVVRVQPEDRYNPWYIPGDLFKSRRACQSYCSAPPAPRPPEEEVRSCNSTRQCGYAESCVSGTCQPETPLHACSAANPCAAGEHCQAGRCIP